MLVQLIGTVIKTELKKVGDSEAVSLSLVQNVKRAKGEMNTWFNVTVFVRSEKQRDSLLSLGKKSVVSLNCEVDLFAPPSEAVEGQARRQSAYLTAKDYSIVEWGTRSDAPGSEASSAPVSTKNLGFDVDDPFAE